MIEEGLDEGWPAEVRDALVPFMQGHLIESPPFSYVADLRYPIWEASRRVAQSLPADDLGEDFIDLAAEQRPPLGIITTQTCDLCEQRLNPRQPWLMTAPVYQLPQDSMLRDREYIYPLEPPDRGTGWVADLRIEMPLEKGALVGRIPIAAFPEEGGYIQFANVLARRRGRPALANVFHEVMSDTTDRLKKSNATRKLARATRPNVYKLMLAIEDGTRLQPVAAKLYVVTAGQPTADTLEWFGLWWDEARTVAQDHGLRLLPTGWLNAREADLNLVDELVEIRNPA